MGKSTKNDHFDEIDQKRHETGQKPGVSWDLMKKGLKMTKIVKNRPKNRALGCHHEKIAVFKTVEHFSPKKTQKDYKI